MVKYVKIRLTEEALISVDDMHKPSVSLFFLVFFMSVIKWTPYHRAVYLTHTLLPQPHEACAGQKNQVKICQMGQQWKLAHRLSKWWFIGLISENGKVKLITFPPENAAKQWQMTSCQGQTVSHPWSLCLCAPFLDSLTQVLLCQMPPSGWQVP